MKNNEADTFQASYCAERLKALADPLRLRIVELLLQGEMTVGDIAEFLEHEVVTVSHHLQILKHANLVIPRREGRFVYYKLHEDVSRGRSKSRQLLNLGCCTLAAAMKSDTT